MGFIGFRACSFSGISGQLGMAVFGAKAEAVRVCILEESVQQDEGQRPYVESFGWSKYILNEYKKADP